MRGGRAAVVAHAGGACDKVHALDQQICKTGKLESSGDILYRIKSSTREQLADESELKLALKRKDIRE
jgi:hypothetical protein